ncbi:expressed unknown protein [Seminavis robusta]|uniref:Uncharacterized protein n=1 Tax=Seminavis robusta TaxID=568900 RepID=A0A9N8E6I2_9STRA|nr:expressed unknown protein [Seminavis robusta]|eukprot:Sro725_g193340.1 n/a (311) ;mRNA; f:35501-36433
MNFAASATSTTIAGTAGTSDANELSEFELEWAWEIKEAIDRDEELNPISDYEVAQLAIVTLGQQEDLYSIRERVLALQCLRQEHKLTETPQEGVELMRQLTCQQQPGHILAFDLAQNQSHYIGVFDFARNKPSAVQTDKDWRVYLGGYYYLLNAANSNLTTIRNGFTSIVECDGMGYHSFSHSMQQRWATELGMHFPIETKESKWFHTPTAANIMCSFVKPWMSSRKARWDRIQLGCQLDSWEGRIDSLINLPTPQVAQQKLLHNLHLALMERYHNQATFRLPDKPIEEYDHENGNSSSMMMDVEQIIED